MGYRKIKSSSRVVTKVLARQVRDSQSWAGERPLSRRNLESIKHAAEAGELASMTWAIVKCLENGITYRVNGHHTSTVLSDLDLPEPFKVNLDEYECDKITDVASLWATFDRMGSSRGQRDMNRAFVVGIDELENIPSRILNLTVSGLAYFNLVTGTISEREFDLGGPSMKASLIRSEVEFAQFVFNLYEGETGQFKKLHRAPVAAAMYSTWKRDSEKAKEFWIFIRDENASSEANHPTRRLAKLLVTFTIRKDNYVGRNAKTINSREMYALCIHYFNKFKSDDHTAARYFHAAPVPDPI